MKLDTKEYESKINALLDVLDELEVAGESVGFTRITLRNLKQNGKKYKATTLNTTQDFGKEKEE